MKVLLNAFGTEGDVAPFVALARALTAAGHQAAVCTPAGFGTLVRGYGVEHLPMDNAALDLIRTEMSAMRGPADTLRIQHRMRAAMRQMMLDEWQAAQSWRPDAVVHHPKCLGALHIAEKLDLPVYTALPLPFLTPTTAFPIPFIGNWPLGGTANRASYALNHVTMLIFGSMINSFRTGTLGLKGKPWTDVLLHRPDGTPLPILYPFSPELVPRPDDYPEHAHITGPWNLGVDPAWTPPADLLSFLDAGAAPVYVGFGSMGFGQGAAQRTTEIVDALLDQNHRVLLATGWGGLSATHRPGVFSVGSAPHEWLFPRTKAVIHHGGSGTTHSGLQAGRPTLICPFLGDQPFWGHRVHASGAGPAPIPSRKITRARIAPALDQLLHDESIRSRAELLGKRLRAERGAEAAVQIITGGQP